MIRLNATAQIQQICKLVPQLELMKLHMSSCHACKMLLFQGDGRRPKTKIRQFGVPMNIVKSMTPLKGLKPVFYAKLNAAEIVQQLVIY